MKEKFTRTPLARLRDITDGRPVGFGVSRLRSSECDPTGDCAESCSSCESDSAASCGTCEGSERTPHR